MPINTDNRLDVMILAGGFGNRLKSAVSDRQKVVAAVKGRPFLLFLLEQLEKIAVNKLIFCTGHMQETVMQALNSYSTRFNMLFSHEETPLGTGGAVRQAVSLTESPDILIMNGDSFIDCDLMKFCDAYRKNDYRTLMLLTGVDDVSRFGMVTLDDRNRITAFNEKGEYSGKGMINAGIYLLKKELLEEIPASCQYSLEKQFFPQLVSRKELYGYLCDGKFIDIGTCDSYDNAQTFFEQQKTQPGN